MFSNPLHTFVFTYVIQLLVHLGNICTYKFQTFVLPNLINPKTVCLKRTEN